MVVVVGIITNVVFGIVIYREGPTPSVRIIIVVDEAKGSIIMERRIVVVVVKVVFVVVSGIIFVVVFEIIIVVVLVVKDPALVCLVLPLDVGIIIV